jgi:hypothetical protein
MDKLKTFIDSIPKPVRDFLEGAVATGIGGAADQVLSLNLGLANSKLVLVAAGLGFTNAVIAYARRKGVQPVATPGT